eukprot:GHVP01029803.1.p1 GENE.GHVP01029803.1~~GHVP01029803.1.p1  ORF type:complete len:129 (+),score=20.67 GHVP01029803.1:137-523(+)
MVIIMLFFVFFFALFMVIINFFLKDVWKDENGEKEISATLLSILKKRNSGQSIEQHKIKMEFGRMRIYFYHATRFWVPPLIVAVLQSKLATSNHSYDSYLSFTMEEHDAVEREVCYLIEGFLRKDVSF